MPKKSAPPSGVQPVKITAAHIRRGLAKMFPHPECGIVFEVAQGTGWNANRHLDAIAMDTWPSRGLTISGIEIKVSRSDWRREKADPSKAEQLARFCDKFYIAAPPDLIPVEDLPDAWGLLEGGADGMRIKKAAAKTKAEPVTRDFLAAVFRASGRGLDADDVALRCAAEEQRLRDRHDGDVKTLAERLSTNNSEDAKNWRALVEALGAVKPDGVTDLAGFRHMYEWDAAKWISTIRAVHASGVMESWNGLAALAKTLGDMKARVDAAVDILHAPVPDEMKAALDRFRGKRKGEK